MKQETMETLKIEESELIKKMLSAREKGDYGTYKNLVNALDRVLTLQDNQSYETKWSKYRIVKNGKKVNVISVWEQRGDDVKNHRLFEVVKEIEVNNNVIDITDYVTDDNNGLKSHYHSVQNKTKITIEKDIYNEYLNTNIDIENRIVLENKIYKVNIIDMVTDKSKVFLELKLL